MAGSAQSARSGHHRKRHKRPASNHLRGDADQAREGTSRVGASLLKSDLMLAAYKTPCNLHGRGCLVLHFAQATEVAGGVGHVDTAPHFPLLTQSEVRGRWLQTGRLRASRRQLHRIRFIAPPSPAILIMAKARGKQVVYAPRPWGSLGVALGWPWGGIGVALG